MRTSWNTVPASALAPSSARGGGSARVGASILQTPGGIQDELARINTDFELFDKDFTATIGRLGPRPFAQAKSQELANLYDNVWRPLFAHWQKWRSENDGWWDNFWWNHAPTGEQYLKQMNEIRERVRALGAGITSPAPAKFAPSLLFDPEHNLADDAADAARRAGKIAGDTAEKASDLLKLAGFAVIGIGGLLILDRFGSGGSR